MSLHTGGRAFAATSTRSRSYSCASSRAFASGTMPTCSPLGPTSRTSGTRIRSLMRGSALMGPPRLHHAADWPTAAHESVLFLRPRTQGAKNAPNGTQAGLLTTGEHRRVIPRGASDDTDQCHAGGNRLTGDPSAERPARWEIGAST